MRESTSAKRFLPHALLLALAILPFLNALPNSFTLDDFPIILENPLTHSLRLTPRIFSSGYWSEAATDNYRPLVVWTYALNHALCGFEPWAFRIVNLALYAGCGLLVFGLIRRLFDSYRLALTTGILFVIHPIHVESVVSITGRDNLMMTLFLLLALLCYLRVETATTRAEHARWLGASLLCFFLALLSKEQAITLLALIPLLDVTRQARAGLPVRNLLQRWQWYVAFLAVAAIYFCIRIAVLGVAISTATAADAPTYAVLEGQPLYVRWATALRAWGVYVELLLWPARLSYHHEIPFASGFGFADVLWPAAILAMMLAGIGWAAMRRAAIPFFALGFFLFTYLPVANALVPIGTLVAERLLFLPSLGFALGIAWQLSRAPRIVLISFLAALTVAAGSRVAERNREWQSEVTLYRAALKHYPHSSFVHHHIGAALARAGNLDEAESHFWQAMALRKNFWSTYYNLGVIYEQHHRDIGKARQLYAQAAALDPLNTKPQLALGIIASREGRTDDALAHYQRALEINPQFAPAHNGIGAILARAGKFDEAEAAFRRCLALDPTHEGALENLRLLQIARAQRKTQ